MARKSANAAVIDEPPEVEEEAPGIEFASSRGFAEIKFELIGTAPLLFNKSTMPYDWIQDAPRRRGAKAEPPEVTCPAKLHKLPDGQLCFPSMAIKKAIKHAGSNLRHNKVSITSLVKGTIFTTEPFTALFHPRTGKPIVDKLNDQHGWEINLQLATNRNTRPPSQIWNPRPMVREWTMFPVLRVDMDVWSDAMGDVPVLLQLLNRAGIRVGLGSFRVECDGEFGTFTAQMA